MTPQELREYLAVAREAGCTSIKIGEVTATLAPLGEKPQLVAPTAEATSPEEHWDQVDRKLWPAGGA